VSGFPDPLEVLPHRPPFLFVDEVVRLEPGVGAAGRWRLDGDEDFFAGHFPGRPVMPGVLMLEAMAQTAALLTFSSAGQDASDGQLYYFVGIDGARFKRPVEPGDQLLMDAELLRAKSGIYKYKTRATVGGELAVEAELMCTVRNRE